MQLDEIAKLEKKVRLKKMETNIDEYELSKLKLMQKIAKLDEEIVNQKEAIELLKKELGE